jgi:hypothetical protein
MTQDAMFLEYFNIKRKFEGSILGISNKNVLVQTVVTDLIDEDHKKRVQTFAIKEGINLATFSEQQKGVLYEVSKLTHPSHHPVHHVNWQKFCLDLCQSEQSANQLASMVTHLVKLDIHGFWLNIAFAKAYKMHNGDSTRMLNDLLNEFNQINFKSVKESQRLLSELDAQIPNWENKAKFDKLYKELETNVSQLERYMSINNNSSTFEQFILIQNARKYIDLMDRTIKSLAYSRDYSNNEPENILRAERYRKLVTNFYDHMKPWLALAYPLENEQIKVRRFQEQFEEALKLTEKDDKKEIRSTTGFDVRKTVISRKAISLDCKTIEDCFTCIHQNFNAAIDNIEQQQNLIIARDFYPLELAQFEEGLMKLRTNNRMVSNPINHLHDPSPYITYNLPLSIHNGSITVCKSPQNDAFFLFFIVGSPFSEDSGRWSLINTKSQFDMASSDIPLVSDPPQFPYHGKNYTYSAQFNMELSSTDIPAILKTIKNAIDGTFTFNKHTPEDEERFQLLEQMDDLTLNKVQREALALIQRGYYGSEFTSGFYGGNHFFNTNTAERIRILHRLFTLPDSKVEIDRFNIISSLLDSSTEQGLKSLLSELYVTSHFDDTFFIELTGFSKIEFIKQYFCTNSREGKVERMQMILQEIKNPIIDQEVKQAVEKERLIKQEKERENDLYNEEPSPEYREDFTRLERCASDGRHMVLEILLRNRIDVNKALGDNHKTALMYVAETKSIRCAELLIKYKAEINQTDKDGMTALMYAVRSGISIPIIKALIAKGADLNTANKEGKTVFDLTANDDILKILREVNSKAPATLLSQYGLFANNKVSSQSRPESSPEFISENMQKK